VSCAFCDELKELIMTKLDTGHREKISATHFAFPKQRKEPLEDASHVRNAVARFDQVEGVSDADRDEAWKRIKAAGRKYGVEINEESWRELEKGTAARERSTKNSG
jgi:hypothetical protein